MAVVGSEANLLQIWHFSLFSRVYRIYTFTLQLFQKAWAYLLETLSWHISYYSENESSPAFKKPFFFCSWVIKICHHPNPMSHSWGRNPVKFIVKSVARSCVVIPDVCPSGLFIPSLCTSAPVHTYKCYKPQGLTIQLDQKGSATQCLQVSFFPTLGLQGLKGIPL